MIVLEICANGIANALRAQKYGAHRVELCENLESGGLTPSYGTLRLAAETLSVPVHVLVRPRRGNYVYDKTEMQVMLHEINLVKQFKFDGIVIGTLRANGELDETAMRKIMEKAEGVSITFHRAIDVCTKPEQAIEMLISLGVNRLLTSGGAPASELGLNNIAHWQRQFGNDITIMAGSGINSTNALRIIKDTGINEIHMSVKSVVQTQLHRYLTQPDHDTGEWWHHGSDTKQIALVRKLLDELNAKQDL